jgi:hypothetical protein
VCSSSDACANSSVPNHTAAFSDTNLTNSDSHSCSNTRPNSANNGVSNYAASHCVTDATNCCPNNNGTNLSVSNSAHRANIFANITNSSPNGTHCTDAVANIISADGSWLCTTFYISEW